MTRKKGFALALALILMPLCMLLMYLFVDKVLIATHASMHERGRSQTFHMAEAGLVVAYDAFQANNFAGLTHRLVSGALVTDTTDSKLVLPNPTPGNMAFAPDAEGWYRWRWKPGDPPGASYCDGTETEMIRFRIYYPSQGQWRIDCQGQVGTWTSTHSQVGTIENNAEYAIYSAGDMNDLTKADNVTVNGKIHANGNLYLLPRFMTNFSPSVDATGHFLFITKTLKDVVWPVVVSASPGVSAKTLYHNPPLIPCNITSAEVEAGGKIIRSTNAHGDPYTSTGQTITSTGCVTITVPGFPSKELTGGPTGVALDSNNPNWKTIAVNNWGKLVRDAQLGSRVRNSFDPRAIEVGGYYHHQALSKGLFLDGVSGKGTWLKVVQFYNNSENRLVSLYDIDVNALATSSDWPQNGLIYSPRPVRLYNCKVLKAPLTLVSPATIYTKGNFNADYAGAPHKPAALVTTDRIYHLSDAWVDSTTPAPPTQTKVNDHDHPPILPDQFPPHAANSDSIYPDQLVINADLVDGPPVINELNWVPSHKGMTNPYYSNIYYLPHNPSRPHKGYRWQASINAAAGSDCLLEEFHQLQMVMDEPNKWDSHAKIPKNPDPDFPPVTLVRTGSVMHLQSANMGGFNVKPPDWDSAPGVTPWMVRSFYTPWVRIFNNDPLFQPGPSQQLPVFAPNVSTKTLWTISN